MAFARSRGGGVRATILLPLIGLMALAACGSASSARVAPPGGQQAPAPTAAASSGSGETGPMFGEGQGDGAGQGGAGATQAPAAPRDQAKIVYTGSLQLVVGD